jgi:hypothetical protein
MSAVWLLHVRLFSRKDSTMVGVGINWRNNSGVLNGRYLRYFFDHTDAHHAIVNRAVIYSGPR